MFDLKLTADFRLIRCGLEDEWNLQLCDRWEILFKDIYVDDVIYIFSEKAKSFPKKNHSGLMRSRNQAECNPQCFNRPVCVARIFLNDNRDILSHKRFVSCQVNDRNGLQVSISPESTTSPQRDIRGSVSVVGTLCCWQPYAQTKTFAPA